ncbi:MAG TPA: hypothetical protein VGL66_02035 [Caulobacteraceae bacterium]|jgi:hypothetical protein
MAADRPVAVPIVALAGAALSAAAVVLAAASGGTAWRAWMAAAFLAFSASAGSIGFLMMLRIIPGAWREELAGLFDAHTRLLPIGLIAGLPVLFTLASIYPWPHRHEATEFRAAYLSQGFFIGRTLIWWAVLGGLAILLTGPKGRSVALASIGLMLFTLLGTTGAVDWLESIDPNFASSGFGLYLICTQLLTGLALCVLEAAAGKAPLKRPQVLGGVLVVLLLLWNYLAFMQYFIVWSGDLPPGAAWYIRRVRHGWGAVMWVVALSRLAPLFALFFGPVRASRRWLAAMSAVIATGTVFEFAWLALPRDSRTVGAAEAAVYLLGVAGLALIGAALLRRLRARSQKEEAAIGGLEATS